MRVVKGNSLQNIFVTGNKPFCYFEFLGINLFRGITEEEQISRLFSCPHPKDEFNTSEFLYNSGERRVIILMSSLKEAEEFMEEFKKRKIRLVHIKTPKNKVTIQKRLYYPEKLTEEDFLGGSDLFQVHIRLRRKDARGFLRFIEDMRQRGYKTSFWEDRSLFEYINSDELITGVVK